MLKELGLVVKAWDGSGEGGRGKCGIKAGKMLKARVEREGEAGGEAVGMVGGDNNGSRKEGKGNEDEEGQCAMEMKNLDDFVRPPEPF